jgi:hypothetical protein
MQYPLGGLVSALMAALLVACGGDLDPNRPPPSQPHTPAEQVATLPLLGSVTGLAGDLVIRKSSGELTTLRADGPFGLSPEPVGSSFEVLVERHPPGQHCVISNGSGVVGIGLPPIDINCHSSMFVLNVDVLALTKPVTLRRDDGAELTLTATGIYPMPGHVRFGNSFSNEVVQASGQVCALENASGTALGPLPNLRLTCDPVGRSLGGLVAGLASTIALASNDGQVILASSNGPFRFPRAVPNGFHYQIRVKQQPAGQLCAISNSEGSATADVDNIQVTCQPAVESPNEPGTLPSPTNARVSYEPRSYLFTWDQVPGATYYQVREDIDGAGPAQPTSIAISATPHVRRTIPGALHEWINAEYTVSACAIGGCGLPTALPRPDINRVISYLKASNTAAGDMFGSSIAVSSDGRVLAVGAPKEDSSSRGPNGNQSNNDANDSGAVYVYERTGSLWKQTAYLKSSNASADDLFGKSLALSGDGMTLAVSAPREASETRGIDGNQASRGAPGAGAVFVFVRSDSNWRQQAYVKASNSDAGDWFGEAVALSATGDAMIVGAPRESSKSQGVNSQQSDNTAPSAGAAYMFSRTGSTWSQAAYLKAKNAEAGDLFGSAVAISANGEFVIVGAPGESGDHRGVFAVSPTDNNLAQGSGAAYAFSNAGGWSQLLYIKASNTSTGDAFGTAVSVAGNGVGIGAPYEDSATGLDEASGAALDSGAAYIFARRSSAWSQTAYVKAPSPHPNGIFATSLALAADGKTLLVGAPGEASTATGIGGDQANSSKPRAGSAFVYIMQEGWQFKAYLKSIATDEADAFGSSVTVSSDGTVFIISAPEEDGGDANPLDNGAANAGAVYAY